MKDIFIVEKFISPSRFPPRIPPAPSCAADTKLPQKRARAKKNSFPPAKIVFALPRPHYISPRHTARILGGQNPEKTPFPFSKEISPPPNQKCKECFLSRLPSKARRCGASFSELALSPSVRFRSKSSRALCVAHCQRF